MIDLIYMYLFFLSFVSAFIFAFIAATSILALRVKLKGGEFFEALYWYWANC